MNEARGRSTRAEIDLAALQANVATIAGTAPSARLWAVVKANGYGHGAVQSARAALAGGASGLCVALAEEGAALRDAGITDEVLILSELSATEADLIASRRLTATVTTVGGAAALERAWAETGSRGGVHIKVDTGMHRVGVAPDGAVDLARAIDASPHLELAGVYSHLAVADDPGHEANRRQLEAYRGVLDALRSAGIDPGLRHLANSAATLTDPETHFDLVRVGIALYGLRPGPALAAHCAALRPVMSIKSSVSAVRWVDAGDAVSYGLRRPLPERSWVATIPIGYADGIPRRSWESSMPVLIGGRRRPIAGTVTMDQIIVDCGPRDDVAVGDEVVLIGSQGAETITADDWATATGTIGYEIVCGVGERVPRRYR